MSSSHAHTIISCVILNIPLNPPSLFVQPQKRWTLTICTMDKTPLCWKTSMVPDLGFLPELRYSGAQRPVRLWRVGGAAQEASGDPEPFRHPHLSSYREAWAKGSHPSSATTPSHQHLHSGVVPTYLALLPTSWSLFSQVRQDTERETRCLFLPSNQDSLMASFQSENGFLGNQVLTRSNS